MKRDIHRKTDVGNVIVSLERGGSTVQANIYLPPRGPALFAVFPEETTDDEAADAVVALALRDDIEPETNLTGQVPGALAAGAMGIPRFQLGIPHVKHADEVPNG